jgi:AraC-like DNA-binding protein
LSILAFYYMKVVQFTIPVSSESTIVVQSNILPHFYNHLHRHREVQIEWVVDGSGMLIAGNYMQRFESGDVYIIGPNQPHIFKSDPQYFDSDEKREVFSVSIFFDPNFLTENLFHLPEMLKIRKFVGTLHNGFQIPAATLSLVKKTIADVVSLAGPTRISSFITLMHMFASIRELKPLSTGNSEQMMSDSEGMRMDQIFQYLVTHYKTHISLNQIAEIANLTPQAFCRYFKKHTDKTFVTFLNEVRINAACKMINSSSFESFSEVSFQNGFDNVTSFNRVFKKMMGKSPREFQRDFRNKLF